MRGGAHVPGALAGSKISPEVTPPAYKACPPPGSVTTVRLRKPISRAVETVLPLLSVVVNELGDWKTRVQIVVVGLYCQISACIGR